MNDIFISYAKEDRDRARTLAEAVKQHGWSVFWDRSIPPGKTWDEAIGDALYNSKCIIVLWSKVSVHSDWVKEEANIGKQRNILVPALIDKVDIPIGFTLIQAADLINWKTDKLDPNFMLLIDSITEKAGTPSIRKLDEEEEHKVKVKRRIEGVEHDIYISKEGTVPSKLKQIILISEKRNILISGLIGIFLMTLLIWFYFGYIVLFPDSLFGALFRSFFGVLLIFLTSLIVYFFLPIRPLYAGISILIIHIVHFIFLFFYFHLFIPSFFNLSVLLVFFIINILGALTICRKRIKSR